MTEQEAVKILEEVKMLDDTLYAYSSTYMKALEAAIKALEEIQKYRKIGTVEECRVAVEKQKTSSREWKEIASDNTDYMLDHYDGSYTVYAPDGKCICEFIHD